MSQAQVNQAGNPSQIYCPQCGKPMRIAPQHVQVPVSCPHCRQTLEPWRIVAATQPVSPYAQGLTWDGYSHRNRWIAGALGVLLGTFGVHRFYMGFTGIGIIQIIVCIFTAGIVSSIWGFIEGILCFCGAMHDVEGRPLRG